MKYDWESSANDAAKRLGILANKPDAYTDDDVVELRALLSKGVFAIATHAGTMQFRAALDMVDAVRKFDRASARLTSHAIVVMWATLLVALASLIVSLIALWKVH